MSGNGAVSCADSGDSALADFPEPATRIPLSEQAT